MKISKIEKLVKKTKTITLYIDDEQWISNGQAIYPLRGLPRLTVEQVLQLLNIDKEDAGKYLTRVERPWSADKISFMDRTEDEKTVNVLPYSLHIKGCTRTAVDIGRGIVWVRSSLIDPILEKEEAVEVCRRPLAAGGFYLVVKVWMFLAAVILDTVTMDKETLENYEDLLARSREASERFTQSGAVQMDFLGEV